MKPLFPRNISNTGRLVRALGALVLLIGAGFGFFASVWLGAGLAVSGVFDVQLRGPYTLWHHAHTFEGRDGGTLCLDHVRYRPRGGALVNWLFVRRDVERIFQYRQQRMLELFGTKAEETVHAASKR